VTRLLLSPDEGVERAPAGIELLLRACSERVELGRTVHYIDRIGTLAQHHPRAGRHITTTGSIAGGSVVSRWSTLLVGGRQHHEFSG
jgi:hypothetical protein